MSSEICLGFDFGLKRIGVAIGQALTKTANPLSIIAANFGVPNWGEVDKLINHWQPENLIVGIPLSMTGEDLSVTDAANQFAMQLQVRYKLPVYRVDERLTTKAAREKIFQEHGYKGLKTKPIDSVAAQLMVEAWLQEHKEINMNNEKMNPRKFGKVAVLFGGISAEREVSLNSGQNVLQALIDLGVDAHGVDVGHDVIDKLRILNPDRAFIVLHGRPLGEDGIIQSLLEIMQIPYTGSGVMASALTMDKQRTNLLWQGLGLPAIPSLVFYDNFDPAKVIKQFAFPLCVKPSDSGSSCGVSKVEMPEQLAAAYKLAKQHGTAVVVQPWIKGRELTAAILGDDVLPTIEIVTPQNTFYDYAEKYLTDTTNFLCPCELTVEEEAQISDLALRAFQSTGCRHWGRVDFIQDENKKLWLLEVNTIPGMTGHSLVPKAAKQAGIAFGDLVCKILTFTL